MKTERRKSEKIIFHLSSFSELLLHLLRRSVVLHQPSVREHHGGDEDGDRDPDQEEDKRSGGDPERDPSGSILLLLLQDK